MPSTAVGKWISRKHERCQDLDDVEGFKWSPVQRKAQVMFLLVPSFSGRQKQQQEFFLWCVFFFDFFPLVLNQPFSH